MTRSTVGHIFWDPKDDEPCLNRVKPEETLEECLDEKALTAIKMSMLNGNTYVSMRKQPQSLS